MSAEQKLAEQLGKTLARARLAAGYAQELVAEHIGVNAETISRFERGAVLPTLPRLVELAELYQVPVSTLLRRSSPRAIDLAEELADKLSHLNDADRLWVSQWLTELCERLRQSAAGGRTAKKPHR
ncbi:Transcriptional regulator, XRE family [Paraburkholderia piptadeniae]|uniref:Transcriptional regulator, XRE family n=1 Tax=Paraburkholderia piptadeniae TaxID=1701573 RepID=A0A1N7S329_9BURK|nr:helix-turn-helix transcriptional regulator [Paraburkholderia piptadeniae]SIT41803.1 Transcriptional regulator, XRE family [Paraburkholderia piptadeniae]